jgi:hypothetical protein
MQPFIIHNFIAINFEMHLPGVPANHKVDGCSGYPFDR